MDESVRGDYLSISDLHINTTPFLSGDADIINFGVAVSGANCSTLSRMIFRFGIRPDQVANWRSALRNPTMWEYAKRAGYTTVFIDTYFGLLDYGSGFSPIESRSIDRKLSVLVSPTYVRDYKLIDVIADVLIKSHDEKIFLYVDKFGTHTPYINTYAPNYSRYGSTDGSEKEIVKAQYKNAISWSVDGFFEKLKDRIDLANTLLIYTSDHGQSLYDGGYKLSHCSVNGPVVPGEGYVPLFAMTHVESYNRELRQAARSGQGHFSHFEIFPTLLNAMGFEPSFIKGRYGRSLLEVPVAATSRGFYVGNPKGVLRRIMIDADPAAR
jgi:lipid A ethanolaminephosphotransferase